MRTYRTAVVCSLLRNKRQSDEESRRRGEAKEERRGQREEKERVRRTQGRTSGGRYLNEPPRRDSPHGQLTVCVRAWPTFVCARVFQVNPTVGSHVPCTSVVALSATRTHCRRVCLAVGRKIEDSQVDSLIFHSLAKSVSVRWIFQAIGACRLEFPCLTAFDRGVER